MSFSTRAAAGTLALCLGGAGLAGTAFMSGDALHAGEGASADITILSVSDFHGTLEQGVWGDTSANPNESSSSALEWSWQVSGAARIGQAVKAQKALDPEAVVVGGGDMVGDVMTRPTLALGGWPSVGTLNALGMEYSAVGNHETNLGQNQLLSWQKQLKGKYLVANAPGTWLESMTPKHPVYGAGVDIKEIKGVRVAFIGVAAEASQESGYYGEGAKLFGKVAPAVQTANRIAERIKKDDAADAVVVMAHLGLNGEGKPEEVGIRATNADWSKAIDAVVGGHTHRTFSNTENDGKQTLVQPSSYGRVVGKIVLHVEDGEVTSAKPSYVKTDKPAEGDPYGLTSLENAVHSYAVSKNLYSGSFAATNTLMKANAENTNLTTAKGVLGLMGVDTGGAAAATASLSGVSKGAQGGSSDAMHTVNGVIPGLKTAEQLAAEKGAAQPASQPVVNQTVKAEQTVVQPAVKPAEQPVAEPSTQPAVESTPKADAQSIADALKAATSGTETTGAEQNPLEALASAAPTAPTTTVAPEPEQSVAPSAAPTTTPFVAPSAAPSSEAVLRSAPLEPTKAAPKVALKTGEPILKSAPLESGQLAKTGADTGLPFVFAMLAGLAGSAGVMIRRRIRFMAE